MPDGSDNPNTRPTAMAPDASASPVDWSRPIEAVHEDGRVVACSFVDDDGTRFMPMHVHGVPIDGPGCHYTEGFFERDGTRKNSKWRIRNVQPTTPELDPALWDRMVALVRNMVRENTAHWSGDYAVARAIVADLLEPVDPDDDATKQLLDDLGWALGSQPLDDVQPLAIFNTVKAAIKRGRQLATPGVSHVG